MNKSAIIVMLVVLFLVPGLAAAGFMDNGNGTVTDTVTNLMWQQCSEGYTTTTTTCDTAGATVTFNWETAISTCEDKTLGGFTDWRLPNIKELRSIVDSTRATAPAINTTNFPATALSYYWSSTSYAPNTASAWVVNFNAGFMGNFSKAIAYFVRCVR